MSKQLFPSEIIDNSIEKFVAKHSIKTHLIYNIVIAFVAVMAILIFFLSVDINVNSTGIIKSPGERLSIGSPYSALVENIEVTENQYVNVGDVLLVLNSERQEKELSKHTARLHEIIDYESDIKLLLMIPKNGIKIDEISLKTGLYGQSRNYYLSQMSDLVNRQHTSELNYKRSKLLLEQRVVARAEFEPIEADYKNACMAIELFHDRQVSAWRTELDKFTVERRELTAQIEQLQIQKTEAIVKSPVRGIVQRIEGVHNESYVQAGQKLFEISPDSTLFVECMIPPKDIGYIKIGQNVMMQVEAFNYNEWGLAQGRIAEIFHDVMMVQTPQGNAPYFKVMCSLDTEHLQLKNGYKGVLKRGMTVNARFKITERTLFQLLYDNVDDWLNPNNSSQK